VEATRSWGLISADVVSRAAGEATWLSDRHRITYALTEISATIESDGRRVHETLDRGKVSFRPAGDTFTMDLPRPVRVIQILQHPGIYHNFVVIWCAAVRFLWSGASMSTIR
jgi:hypothetical protein